LKRGIYFHETKETEDISTNSLTSGYKWDVSWVIIIKPATVPSHVATSKIKKAVSYVRSVWLMAPKHTVSLDVNIDVENPSFVDQCPSETMGFRHLYMFTQG